MRRCLQLLAVIFLYQYLPAQTTLLSQLKTVNYNWAHLPEFTRNLPAEAFIDNEKELIQTHLTYAIKYLENRRAWLSEETALKRANSINELKNYCAKGVFPINNHHAKRQPYFIDDFGNYCAVGFLLKQSGFDTLAQLIHSEMNYAYIKEIPANYLTNWANENGFTIDELALIQPNYYAIINCLDDTFFIGKNKSTTCRIFQNDLINDDDCYVTHQNFYYQLLDSAKHGTVTTIELPTDTLLVYQPDSNHIGLDSIRYLVNFPYAGSFCASYPDTASILFQVISDTSNIITILPGDCNYDSKIDDKDFILLCKSIGKTGTIRPSNSGICEVTYTQPWNDTTDKFNVAACDLDGNGTININDLDLQQTCFITENNYEPYYYENRNMPYSLTFAPYDTSLTAGDSFSLKCIIKSTGNSIVPLKAISMHIYQQGLNRLNALATNLNLLPFITTGQSYISKHFIRTVADWSGRARVYTGATAIEQINNQPEHTVLLDTFLLEGQAIPADSIHSDGFVGLNLYQITGLDANDSIVIISDIYVPFNVARTVSGIFDVPSTNIGIYPNPTHNELNVTLPEKLLGSIITINDLSSRCLKKMQADETNNTINIANLTNGLYFVTVSKEGNCLTKRFIVQH
jgi:hypothetical protein